MMRPVGELLSVCNGTNIGTLVIVFMANESILST
jgi:hypothetical protein